MAQDIFPAPLVPHEDFELHVRQLAGDQLIDFTGWTFNFVGRSSLGSEARLFDYSELDAGVIEIGTFTKTDSSGEQLDYNLAATIPGSKVVELRDSGANSVNIGLLATPPSGSPIQLIQDARINISKTIAP